MKIENVYKRIRRFYPKAYVQWLSKQLIYADISMSVEKFLSLSFLYSLAFALFVYALLLIFGQVLFSFIVLFTVFFGFHLLIDLLVVLIGDKRGKFVEEVLPDALQLMAANIRSGLTPDKALLFTARPEFGSLEKELRFAASKAIAGEPLEETLLSMGGRIKSRIIERTFTLIVEGMRKGGEMASLLEQTAEDIRNLKLLKREIAAQVGMYAIFIFIATGFAAPLLFSFSTYLVETMSNIGSTLKIGEAAKYAAIGSLRISLVTYSSEFLRFYSFSLLAINSIFGSLLIGLLQEGNEKAGIKYIPILLLLNITVFMVSKFVISQFVTILTPPATLK
jgi:flagellar protein FlaJ